MTMMGSAMTGNAQTITSLGGVLPTPASPSQSATGEVRGMTGGMGGRGEREVKGMIRAD